MPLTFKSQATGDLVMVQAHADALLKLIGKSAQGSGILIPEDMPAALSILRALPEPEPPAAAPDDDAPPPEPSFAEEHVSLRKRAWPFVKMIEEALAAQKPIVWGV